MGRLGKSGKRVEYLAVHLARIRLSRHRVNLVKANLVRYQPIEPAHPIVVTAEQSEKTGLRACCPFRAAEAQRREAMLHFGQIEDEIGAPKTCPLADCCELRW